MPPRGSGVTAASSVPSRPWSLPRVVPRADEILSTAAAKWAPRSAGLNPTQTHCCLQYAGHVRSGTTRICNVTTQHTHHLSWMLDNTISGHFSAGLNRLMQWRTTRKRVRINVGNIGETDFPFEYIFLGTHSLNRPTALHTLLPDLKVTDIVLRNSGTSSSLPHCSYKLYKQSFVNICLFCDCYWCFVLWDIYAIWSDLMYHFFIHILDGVCPSQ